MRKYRNKVIETPEGRFDSLKEYSRFRELRLLERAGEITALRRQEPFELIPTQRRDGRTERPVKYIADFTYTTKDGEKVVEDVKGLKTREYIIKRKLMLWEFGIVIREV